jgi:hypothetical protein
MNIRRVFTTRLRLRPTLHRVLSSCTRNYSIFSRNLCSMETDHKSLLESNSLEFELIFDMSRRRGKKGFGERQRQSTGLK